MRTTVDIDDLLFERAVAKFPPGTPKRVILQEALRALVDGPRGGRSRVVFGAFDDVPVRMRADFDAPIPGFPEER